MQSDDTNASLQNYIHLEHDTVSLISPPTKIPVTVDNNIIPSAVVYLDTVINQQGIHFVWRNTDVNTNENIFYTQSYVDGEWKSLVERFRSPIGIIPKITSTGYQVLFSWVLNGLYVAQGEIYNPLAGSAKLTISKLDTAPQDSSINSFQVTSIGLGEFAITWEQQTASGGTIDIYSAINSTSNHKWAIEPIHSASGNIELGNYKLLPTNSGLGFIWEQIDHTDSNRRVLWSNFYFNGWKTKKQLTFISYLSHNRPIITHSNTSISVFWQFNDTSNFSDIFSTTYSNNTDWQEPVKLTVSSINGDVCCQKILSNQNGKTLATWAQYDRGQWNLYGNVYLNNTWQVPQLITSDSLGTWPWQPTSTDYSVKANSDGFVIVWWENSDSDTILAKRFSQNQWHLTEQVGSTTEFWHMDVASDGYSYAISWVGNDFDVMASVFDGKTWSTFPPLVKRATMFPFSLTSNGNGYAFSWFNMYDVGTNVSLYDPLLNPNWETTFVQAQNKGIDSNPSKIYSNGTEYAVIYTQNDLSAINLYANVLSNSQWSNQVELDRVGNLETPFNFQISSNNSNYAVIWQQNDDVSTNIYANVYDGTIWENVANELEKGEGNAESPQITSNGDGYAVVWRQKDSIDTPDNESPYSVMSNVFQNGSWFETASVVDTSDENVTIPPSIASNNKGYAIVWQQQKGVNNFVYFSELNDTKWQAPKALNPPGSIASEPLIINDGEKYTAGWLQMDEEDSWNVNLWMKARF